MATTAIIKTTRLAPGRYQFLHNGFLVQINSFNNGDGNGDMWEWTICDATSITIAGRNNEPTTINPPLYTNLDAGIVPFLTKRYAVERAAWFVDNNLSTLERLQTNSRYAHTPETEKTVWTPTFTPEGL